MNTQKLNILVVEDNEDHQNAAKAMLGSSHNLKVVGDLDMAIEALQDDDFDVVLTDLNFPEEKEYKKEIGQNGATVVLLALQRGTSKIGMVSDFKGHGSPQMEMLRNYFHRPVVTGESTIRSFNHMIMVEEKRVKNWAKALEELLAAG